MAGSQRSLRLVRSRACLLRTSRGPLFKDGNTHTKKEKKNERNKNYYRSATKKKNGGKTKKDGGVRMQRPLCYLSLSLHSFLFIPFFQSGLKHTFSWSDLMQEIAWEEKIQKPERRSKERRR